MTCCKVGTRSVDTGDQEQWQLDRTAPELYQRYLVPAVTALWAVDLIDRMALRPGERVFDVACGTGVVARLAAERVGHTGRVAGLDINEGMLAIARSLPPVTGAAIDWHEGSALALPIPDATFDVVLCQLGLQFFPDRVAALREMRRILLPAGRVGLNVYGPIEHSPAAQALADGLDRRLGPHASVSKRTEHALARAEDVHGLMAAAGFQDILIRTVTKLVRYPSPEHFVRIQLAATPVASLVAELDPASRDRVVEALIKEVTAALTPYLVEDSVAFPQEAHIFVAHA